MLRLFFISFCFCFSLPLVMAQGGLLSLGGNYGAAQNIRFKKDLYNTVGIQLGIEFRLKKHFTLGGDVDWQFFRPEPTTENNRGMPLDFIVHKRQTNLRLVCRYYFTKQSEGFFIGLSGGYSLLNFQNEFPGGAPFGIVLDDIYQSKNDAGVNLGFLYGYRFRLSPILRISLGGSHNRFRHGYYPAYNQYYHQWGLGLSLVI